MDGGNVASTGMELVMKNVMFAASGAAFAWGQGDLGMLLLVGGINFVVTKAVLLKVGKVLNLK